MNLTLQRLSTDEKATVGIIYIDGKFQCFSLEDTFNEIKVDGRTRIPQGEYEIKLRNEGGMTSRYENRYGKSFHKGMLWLQNVENFKWVYIHTGNYEKDTEGCILVGETCTATTNEKFVGSSINAYKNLYPIVRDAVLDGDKVAIKVVDDA